MIIYFIWNTWQVTKCVTDWVNFPRRNCASQNKISLFPSDMMSRAEPGDAINFDSNLHDIFLNTENACMFTIGWIQNRLMDLPWGGFMHWSAS